MAPAISASAPGAAIRSALDDGAWTAAELREGMESVDRSMRPFDERVLELCAALSDAFLASRTDADAVALGFWLRRASIARMRAAFERHHEARAIVVPRGLVYHVTPANVDTVFVHSWVLSLLAGNINIVRLSSRESEGRTRLLRTIGAVLARDRFAALAEGNRIVITDHDDDVSAALSAACDVRVVWGGDATIEWFRRFPLSPHAREVAFPDRHSIAVIDADAVLALSDHDLAAVSERFFADAYQYDQGACSSPRLVLWRASAGGPDPTRKARLRFHEGVAGAIARRGYRAETGAAINKMVLSLERAASHDGLEIERASNEATWVRLPDLASYDRANCGGGLFFEFESVDLLADLHALARRTDQTATCFGLDAEDVQRLATDLNGRGFDRFVPLGRALDFDHAWDGLDLLREFTRQVTIDVG